MERVLVGVDGSEAARGALGWAADLGRRAGLELHVAGVFTPDRAEGPREQHTALRRDQIHELEQWCSELPEGTPRAHEHLLEGRPASALLDAAHDLDADLLVVGGRGAGGFLDLHLGSVADHLMRNTTVPLAVVPQGSVMVTGHVVVGVDGSPNSLAAARVGADLAAGLEVGVTAVHAFEPFLEWVPANHPDSWHSRAEDELRGWVASVADAGVPVELDVDRDIHPVAAITRALEQEPGSVAVVGARGVGGFRELLLGGVPLQLAHHTSAPVIVVPGDAQED